MRTFATRRKSERADIFTEAAARRGLTPQVLEKDFWVCWTLGRIFEQMGGAGLTFKGGTSLSKVYKVIERFSEDIDLSFERSSIGISDNEDPSRSTPESNNKRKQLVEAIGARVQQHIQEAFVPALKDVVRNELTGQPWSVEIDTADSQTVLFQYPPSIEAEFGYVSSGVRLELGARGEPWPSEMRTISPYVAEEFPDLFISAECRVMVLAFERTFWEKATILHAFHHRAADKPVARNSRHFYDLYRLCDDELGRKAITEIGLLERVVEHKKIFFPSASAKYEEATPGSLRLVPREDQLTALRADYSDMRSMFFGEQPSFEAVMARLSQLESQINGSAYADTPVSSPEPSFPPGT